MPLTMIMIIIFLPLCRTYECVVDLYNLPGDREKEEHGRSERGLVLRMLLHTHTFTFTSTDAPVLVETDNDIPQRFIDGCNV